MLESEGLEPVLGHVFLGVDELFVVVGGLCGHALSGLALHALGLGLGAVEEGDGAGRELELDVVEDLDGALGGDLEEDGVLGEAGAHAAEQALEVAAGEALLVGEQVHGATGAAGPGQWGGWRLK